MILYAFQIAANVFLVFAIAKKNKVCSFLSAGCYIGTVAAHFFMEGIRVGIDIIAFAVVSAIGVILLGPVFSNEQEKKNAHKSGSISFTSGTSEIEKISRLKDLLDRGIITQEEFDAKKKDLIDK